MASDSTQTTATTGPPAPTQTQDHKEMFRAPVNRAMRVLDRSFFRKIVPLSAATVFENSQISKTKNILTQSGDLLIAERTMPVRLTPEVGVGGKDGATPRKEEKPDRKMGTGDQRKKCLLLDAKVKYDDTTTWSPTIQELVAAKTVELGPYNLELDYDYFSYYDIISSILPEENMEEAPVSFTQVGHVAHVNLRDKHLPYKTLLAEILKDKNPSVETVINKVEVVGSQSEFRTFPYEVLAGDGNMNVTVREQDCEFKFDYSKVYWNSRLQTEHLRLGEKFNEGEAVCDVMAGVGPFAIPAGKKRVFVCANDLNPHGYDSMVYAAKRNKVREFVKPFKMDGREFIRHASDELRTRPLTVKIQPTVSPQDAKKQRKQNQSLQQHRKSSRSPSPKGRLSAPPEAEDITTLTRPQTFDHFVMNLPATAIEFLDAFIGVYAGQESLFYPFTDRKLPMIHVYCFSTHSDDVHNEHVDICNRISERLGFTISPEDHVGGSGNAGRELEIYNVRLVAPNKQMFCASFRLPTQVAFAERP
ncbi:tRNA(m(1)G37)methyltransferase [Arachnomyces sp. PD_36]|nr:tRNA(m(1)G37)methyltransferase [Arachnomyces sp. PD_36]